MQYTPDSTEGRLSMRMVHPESDNDSVAGVVWPVIRFDHLETLSGAHGIFEHALHDVARRRHGYTVDDNARAVVVMNVCPSTMRSDLYRRAMALVVAGETDRGWHNRMSQSGTWTDVAGSDDAHGRALWALGSAIEAGSGSPDSSERLARGMSTMKSQHLRPTCYAILGACAALRSPGWASDHVGRFLSTMAAQLPYPRAGDWKWPEDRLTYANARVPQAMIESGTALNDPALVTAGLTLLEWLMTTERLGDHFSFTPTSGRGPDDTSPAFDQQPIEAWAMADACRVAYDVDGDALWREGVELAARWFLGANDGGYQMYDPTTGAGYDGLHHRRRNDNRGAESTLSALGALVAAHRVRGQVECRPLVS